MLLRHAVTITGRRSPGDEELRSAVKALDSWGGEWGLVRHGSLSAELFDKGRQLGIASMFKIVDVAKFAAKTIEHARREV